MKKGFTLLELLIVIAILAILATVTILVLNPAEYLKQTRDAQRMSDMGTIRDAVNLFISTSSTSLTAATNCNTTGCAASSPFAGSVVNTSATTTGAGWVNVNFVSMTGGSPLNKLPVDPTSDTTNFYAYKSWTAAGNPAFEVDAKLESSKYIPNMTNDGGNNNSWYEVGNDLSGS